MISEPEWHAKLVVADRHLATLLSTSLTSGGAGIAYDYGGGDKDQDEDEPRQPNIECGLVVEDAEMVEKLLAGLPG